MIIEQSPKPKDKTHAIILSKTAESNTINIRFVIIN